MMITTPRRVATAMLLAALLVSAAPARAQTGAPAEEFSAFAVNMGVYVAGTTANVVITVNRWSTEEERQEMLTTLRERGTDALLSSFQRAKRIGSLRTPQTVGYELRFAFQETGQDGIRRIFIATDRPIGFAEATNKPVSSEYGFTVIQLNMKPDGTGEGTLALASKIIPAGKNIVVENYDTQPIRLNKVESRKLSKN